MPDFVWRAATASGQITEGRITSASAALALKQLRSQGLAPISLDDEALGGALAASVAALPEQGFVPVKAKVDKGPVKAADVLALSSELAIMLRAGLALDSALRVLIEMSYKPSLSSLLQQMLDDVKSGTALSKALAKHPHLFGDFYVNMVRSGEVSGQMSSVLDRLVEHMEGQRALRESVVSAIIYPAILLVVAILSLVGMLGFVVPQFEKLFTDMGDALPWPTKIVMEMGHLFTRYGVVLAALAFVAGYTVLRLLRSPAGRLWWQGRVLRLPMIGSLALKYQLTLYARSLGTLLGNGVPLLTALAIATDTVGNSVLQKSLSRVSPIVKEGGKVVQAVTATGIFEPLAVNLIRVGEETGRIGPMMIELANILNREVEIGIKRLLTLLEPLLILVLGFLIAGIIISILLGILSINDLAV
ncbi:MAG: type II secretion system F family protein [Acidovorax sp.]|nr:type II secretion system F family protein [Acidovorax sp.]